jgi:hypothetical protein
VFVDFLVERFGPGCDWDRLPDGPGFACRAKATTLRT